MRVRNYLEEEHPYFLSKTKLQWRALNREINSDAIGFRMWTNQHCGMICTYFKEEETHLASPKEQEIWRQERRELARIKRAKKNKQKYEEEYRKKEIEEYEEKKKIKENLKKQNLRSIDKSEIICLDVETTGFCPWEDEILQLSIIDGNKNVLFNEYMKPKQKTEWEAAESIHGITPEMVSEKPNIDTYISHINKIISKAKLLIGYNIIDFDLRFLTASGITVPDQKEVEIYDVMLEFAPIYGRWNEKYKNYTWQSLITCADYYGYENRENFHDSLEDVFATLYCFCEIIKSPKKED